MSENVIVIDKDALKRDILQATCGCGWSYESKKKSLVDIGLHAKQHKVETGHILRKHE